MRLNNHSSGFAPASGRRSLSLQGEEAWNDTTAPFRYLRVVKKMVPQPLLTVLAMMVTMIVTMMAMMTVMMMLMMMMMMMMMTNDDRKT